MVNPPNPFFRRGRSYPFDIKTSPPLEEGDQKGF
jgi:hypothetical protein